MYYSCGFPALLKQLHWLPIEWHIMFKIASITYRALSTTQRALLTVVLATQFLCTVNQLSISTSAYSSQACIYTLRKRYSVIHLPVRSRCLLLICLLTSGHIEENPGPKNRFLHPPTRLPRKSTIKLLARRKSAPSSGCGTSASVNNQSKRFELKLSGTFGDPDT